MGHAMSFDRVLVFVTFAALASWLAALGGRQFGLGRSRAGWARGP
jgi:hypothetical protein